MLVNNQLTLVKVETTPGVDAAPVKTADAINCYGHMPRFDISILDYPVVRASISAAKKRLGRKMVGFSITCPLKSSGTAGTAPEIDALLQACAHKPAISAGVSVAYKPASAEADHKTVTIWHYLDGKITKAVGCMGNFTINLPPGQYPTITFEMRGKLASHADGALVTGPTLQTTEPVIVESSGMSFGAFDGAVVKDFSYQSNMSVVDRLDINSSEGILGTRVTSRDPRWSSTVENTLEATHAWFADFTGRVEEALDLVVGTVAGNIVEFAVPKACIDSGLDPSGQDGVVVLPLSGQALESAGDDNITITFK